MEVISIHLSKLKLQYSNKMRQIPYSHTVQKRAMHSVHCASKSHTNMKYQYSTSMQEKVKLQDEDVRGAEPAYRPASSRSGRSASTVVSLFQSRHGLSTPVGAWWQAGRN